MERYQVILAYDGSHFKGFQRQAAVRTVQGTFEVALRKLGWVGSSILAAGRTDTGAHASGQVVAFDLEWPHPVQDMQQALNDHLPQDVVVKDLRQVQPAYHPRYDASWRRYLYHIYCQPQRDPLLDAHAWRIWPAPELEMLQATARLVTGTHDFSAFGTPPHSEGTPIRSVLSSGWQQEAQQLVYEITAHAFLYHMVRRLVFMQVSIAQGRLDQLDLSRALHLPIQAGSASNEETQPGKRLVHGLAPAHGLVLAEVHYPPSALNGSEDDR